MSRLGINIFLSTAIILRKDMFLYMRQYSIFAILFIFSFFSLSNGAFSKNKFSITGSWIWNQKNLSIEDLKKDGVDRVLTFYTNGKVETETSLGGGEPGFAESFRDERGSYHTTSNRLVIVGPSKLDPESGWPTGNKVDPVKYNCIFKFENNDTIKLSACPISGVWLRLPLKK